MYGDATNFVAYHAARGKDVSSYDDDVINAALVVASTWIDGIYGDSFVGHKTGGFTQADQWPRIGATVSDGADKWKNYYTFPDNVIPDQVKHATYEAALRQIESPGSLQPDYTPSKYKRVSIDGALSVEYAPFSSAADVAPDISIVDTLLWPLLDKTAAASFSGLSGGSSRV